MYNLGQITISGSASYTVPIPGTYADAVPWVCLINKSPYLLSVTVGYHSFYVPAWYYWPIKLDETIGMILPIRLNTFADSGLSTPPSSWYSATVYEKGESPPPGLDQPQSIQSQVSIGSGSVGVAAGATIAVSGPIAVSGITNPVSLAGTIPVSGTVGVSGITTPVILDSGATVYINGVVPVSGNVGLTAGNSVNIAAGANPVTVSGSVSVISQGVSIDNTLINDGAIASTIIESTVYNSPDSNVVIKNDGTWNIVEYVSFVLSALFQIIPGTGIKLGATGRQTEIIGNLLVDGTSTFMQNYTIPNPSFTSLSISGAATALSAGVTNAITAATLTTSGAATASKIKFTIGSLTRLTTGSVTVSSNSSASVTHGLGATPDVVLLTPTSANLPVSDSISVINVGATTIQVVNTSLTTSNVIRWLCIKF